MGDAIVGCRSPDQLAERLTRARARLFRICICVCIFVCAFVFVFDTSELKLTVVQTHTSVRVVGAECAARTCVRSCTESRSATTGITLHSQHSVLVNTAN